MYGIKIVHGPFALLGIYKDTVRGPHLMVVWFLCVRGLTVRSEKLNHGWRRIYADVLSFHSRTAMLKFSGFYIL